MVKNAIRLFILGLLVWPLLINVIGFVSPFWATYVLDDPDASLALQNMFRPAGMAGAVIFGIALAMLTSVDKRVWLKRTSWVLSVFLIGSSSYVFLPLDGDVYGVLIGAQVYLCVLMLIVAGMSLLHILPKTVKPTPADHSV